MAMGKKTVMNYLAKITYAWYMDIKINDHEKDSVYQGEFIYVSKCVAYKSQTCINKIKKKIIS